MMISRSPETSSAVSQVWTFAPARMPRTLTQVSTRMASAAYTAESWPVPSGTTCEV